MKFAAILFDFDGVLIDSEYAGSRHVAEYLSGIGHPTTHEESLVHYVGLSGPDFAAAIERRIGRRMPEDFAAARLKERTRALAEGIVPVAGAAAFVRSLSHGTRRAICSSSDSTWITGHLDHIGLTNAFGPHVYSGREHVAKGKPSPDIYLYAANQLGVPIDRCVIIEDSAVGTRGAVASGAFVIGLLAGTHCNEDHRARLVALGADAVAASFDEVAALIG